MTGVEAPRRTKPLLRGLLHELAFGLAGVLASAVRRPDPWPRVSRYHEVLHALVVFAAGCHVAAIAAALPVLGG